MGRLACVEHGVSKDLDPLWKLIPFVFDFVAGPHGTKIDQQSILIVAKNTKHENVDFYTPPLQNYYFGVPVEAEMEGQSSVETIF